jgi:hypothetical protein
MGSLPNDCMAKVVSRVVDGVRIPLIPSGLQHYNFEPKTNRMLGQISIVPGKNADYVPGPKAICKRAEGYLAAQKEQIDRAEKFEQAKAEATQEAWDQLTAETNDEEGESKEVAFVAIYYIY